MSLISETLRGMNEMHKAELETKDARIKASRKYDEAFIDGLFGKAVKNESAVLGGAAGDLIVELIEANRGRPAGSQMIDSHGNPILDRVIAEPLQGGALTVISRDPQILRIHTYRLDIQQEIVVEINYQNFMSAIYSLRDPVATTN